jgi:hypothetical protein
LLEKLPQPFPTNFILFLLFLLIKVIDGLTIPDVETAKLVEQKIESYLEIKNRNISEEFGN